jgi:hypothetical protein
MKWHLSRLSIFFVGCQACFSESERTSFRPVGFKENLRHYVGFGRGYEHNMKIYVQEHTIDGKLVLTPKQRIEFDAMIIEKVDYDSSWWPWISLVGLYKFVYSYVIITPFLGVQYYRRKWPF